MDANENNVLTGLCQCGCGRPTTIAKYTNKKRDVIAGQPVKFLRGHRRSGKPINDALAAGGKYCRKCKLIVPIEPDSGDVRAKNRRNRLCGPCRREYMRAWTAQRTADLIETRRRWLLKKLYGITLEQYDEMLKRQGGGCAICRATTEDWRANGSRSLPVDHDHKTGKVRGVLCGKCNKGIGLFRDDPTLLQAAVAYLNNQPSTAG